MKFLRSRTFRFLLAALCIAILVSQVRSLATILRRGDVVGERKLQLADIEAQNQRLRQNLAEAQSGEFIEKTAREKLGMIKEGEKIVIVGNDQSASPPAAGEDNGSQDTANWKKWWSLFF